MLLVCKIQMTAQTELLAILSHQRLVSRELSEQQSDHQHNYLKFVD